MAERAEFAALLGGDPAAIEALGLPRIAAALAGLFEGQTPQEFATVVQEFMARAEHRTLGRPLRSVTYRPMLELITGAATPRLHRRHRDRRRDGVPARHQSGPVRGAARAGGRVADRLPADHRRLRGAELRRTAGLDGEANEGAAKVSHIQSQLGRRPLLAAGNSGGDREMLEWAAAAPGGLALLVDHDDADREFAYRSMAVTVDEAEPITAVAGVRAGRWPAWRGTGRWCSTVIRTRSRILPPSSSSRPGRATAVGLRTPCTAVVITPCGRP